MGLPCPSTPLQSTPQWRVGAFRPRFGRFGGHARGRATGIGPSGSGRIDTFHGVRFPSATTARVIVVCRFASPTPSALRVSHPLDGLIPPEPGGFVSRHSRPWDFGLQSFSRPVSRSIFRYALLSCRWAGSDLRPCPYLVDRFTERTACRKVALGDCPATPTATSASAPVCLEANHQTTRTRAADEPLQERDADRSPRHFPVRLSAATQRQRSRR